MTTRQDRAECTECGALIDTSADTPGSRVPCPNCGGIKRTVQFSMVGMTPSNHMLDTFVAHELSRLTECGAKELPTNPNWLSTFILNTVFRVRLDAKPRAYVFNFLRRAEGAASAYRQARMALIEYVETPPNILSPYFRALLNFEVCLSQCYQGYELLATALKKPLFRKKDKSAMNRLDMLYNASKHMDQKIDGGQIPRQATAALWITNHGLQSKGAELSFDELLEMLLEMKRLAEQFSTPAPPS